MAQRFKRLINFFKSMYIYIKDVFIYDFIFFLKNKFCWLFFIFFIFINSFLVVIYVFIYWFYLCYWIYNLYKYKYKNINELAPSKKIYESTSAIKLFLYTELIIKPYLNSYQSIYIFLKTRYESHKQPKLLILFNFLLNILVRLITGFSKKIILNSFSWSLCFYSYDNIINYNNSFFKIIVTSFKELNRVEGFRIYKTNEKIFNFNPKKYNLETLNAIRLYFNNPNLMKYSHLILENSPIKKTYNVIKNVSEYNTVLIPGATSIQHATYMNKPFKTIINKDVKSEYAITFNQTQKDYKTDDLKFKNYVNNLVAVKYKPIEKKVFLTETYLLKTNDIIIKPLIYTATDARTLADVTELNNITAIFGLYLYNKKYVLTWNGTQYTKHPVLNGDNVLETYLKKINNLEKNNFILKENLIGISDDMKHFNKITFSNLSQEMQICTFLATLEKYNPEGLALFQDLNFRMLNNEPIDKEGDNFLL
jgi:hypothetical protein